MKKFIFVFKLFNVCQDGRVSWVGLMEREMREKGKKMETKSSCKKKYQIKAHSNLRWSLRCHIVRRKCAKLIIIIVIVFFIVLRGRRGRWWEIIKRGKESLGIALTE